MNFANEYRKLLQQRITDIEPTFNEQYFQEMVNLFSNHIPEAIDFLDKECTAEEFSWISEIIEAIARKSHSVSLIKVYLSLLDKYPDEAKEYNVASFAESALLIAESFE